MIDIQALIQRLHRGAKWDSANGTGGGGLLMQEAAAALESQAKQIEDQAGRMRSISEENERWAKECNDHDDRACALQDRIEELTKDARRYRSLKARARLEGRDGGWTGYWCLPLIRGWDHTPYSKAKGLDFDYRASLDSAVDVELQAEEGKT